MGKRRATKPRAGGAGTKTRRTAPETLRPRTTITDLPAEVLRNIFIHSMDHIYSEPGVTSIPPKVEQSPIALCHVCSSFREIAIGTAGLWNNFLIDPPKRTTRDHSVEVAQTWFYRSVQPISLRMSSTYNQRPELQKLNPARTLRTDVIRDLIMPHSNRFRHLSLVLSYKQFCALLAFPEDTLLSLESLDIQLGMYQLPDHEKWGVQTPVFHALPRLRQFNILGGPFIEMDLRTLKLPWEQLTTLRTRFIAVTAEVCHEILRTCIALEDAAFTLGVIDDLVTTRLASLKLATLPSLRKVAFNFASQESHILFLGLFSFPGLRALDLRCDGSLPWSQSTIESLLRPSTPNLDRIYIEDEPAGETQINVEKLFCWLPKLKDIRLPPTAVLSDSVMSQIAEGELLRSLEYMTVTVTDLEPLLSMAEARQAMATSSVLGVKDGPVISRMKELVIFLDDAKDPDDDEDGDDNDNDDDGPTEDQDRRMEVLEETGLEFVFNPYTDRDGWKP